MNPRSLSAQLRAIIATYQKAGVGVPKIRLVGDEIIIEGGDLNDALTDEGRKLQTSMDEAFAGGRK